MEKFTSDEIVKDLNIVAPTTLLKVKYGSEEVQPGKVFTPTQVKDPPVVTWDANPQEYYTLIMDDPDFPSRADPQWREILHWSIVNIPGNKLSAGEEKSAYIGSGALQGTGLHRYIFLLYKQKGKQDFSSLPVVSKCSREGRKEYKIAEFTKHHNLGNPVAGNYFQAEYDDYVPLLHKQLDSGADK